MIRKNSFYIALLLIYLLFLTKDSFFGIINTKEEVNSYACQIKDENLKKEYEALLKLVNREEKNENIIYSKVIKRELYAFFDTITLDRGSKDNIKKGDIIISEKGLVGVITKVSKNTSEASLLTNKNTNISVKINDSYGMLYAKDHKLMVKNIILEEKIKVGDTVTTSGLTNIPEGILIGKVKKVNKDSLELEYILDIETSSMKELKYVGVISL